MLARVQAPVAAPVAAPVMNSAVNEVNQLVHCEERARIHQFFARVDELYKSKNSDPKYIKLNVIQRLDCILFDIAKIALEIYYTTPKDHSQDVEFKWTMKAIIDNSVPLSMNQVSCYCVPDVITRQKSWYYDYFNSSWNIEYPCIEVTSEQIDEAFEFHTKVMNIIYQALQTK